MKNLLDKEYRYKTLEEFQEYGHAFVIGEVFADGPVTDGDFHYDAETGMELCMMPGEFNVIVKKCRNLRRSHRKFLDHYRKYNGDLLHGKTLFLWRGGGFGDLLFLRPIIKHLKTLYPDCQILLSTRERFHPLVNSWQDCIDGLANVPFAMHLTMDKSDYHLCFEGLIEQCEEAKTQDVHDLFARHAGLDPDEIEWVAPMEDLPILEYEPANPKYCVVQCKASSIIRTPLMGSIVAAINRMVQYGYDVVLSDGRHNARYLDDIRSCCMQPMKVHNYAHVTRSVMDAVALVSKARLVLAPDSSHMHLAGIQGVPCIGLYGPFPGATRCSRYKDCQWVEPEPSDVCDFGGRHCFTHAYKPCDNQTMCWHNLKNINIINAIDKELSR